MATPKRNAPISFTLSNPTASGPQPKQPENWGETNNADTPEMSKKRKKPSTGGGKSSTATTVPATPPKANTKPPSSKATTSPSVPKPKPPVHSATVSPFMPKPKPSSNKVKAHPGPTPVVSTPEKAANPAHKPAPPAPAPAPPAAKPAPPAPTPAPPAPTPAPPAPTPAVTRSEPVTMEMAESEVPPLTTAQEVFLPVNMTISPPPTQQIVDNVVHIPPVQAHVAGLVPARQLPGGDNYQDELVIRQFAEKNPAAFETLMGLYFQEAQAVDPWVISKQQGTSLSHGWIRNPRRMDVLAANPDDTSIDRWIMPDDREFQVIAADIATRKESFEAAILWWAKCDEPGGYKVYRVLRKAGWIPTKEMLESSGWRIMNDIFQMMEGDEKQKLVTQAKNESPRLFEYCTGDLFCGRWNKRKHGSHEDLGILQVDDIHQDQEERDKEPDSKKRRTPMAGRPTQFHNVPIEERAFDSKGNRLPWALEWPDDHPNARGQKRRVEEKGPFGKANRRKGSSRTRTATPAKKENPTLDGFEKALSFDLQKSAESPPDPSLIRSHSDINIASNHTSTANKDPTQVILFGYPTNLQWQALRTYEDISFGMICEDYDREPPAELRRYPSIITNSPRNRSRPLTKEERASAFKYAGGANWVKVTFDSSAAAERVFEASPIQIHQHWVYAQPYLGVGPDVDEPILITEEERVAGKPLRKHPQRGPSSQLLNTQTQNEEPQQESVSLSSSTASSGTATAPDQSNLRHRNTAQVGQHAPVGAVQTQNPRMMRRFPDQPRTILRPAHEAYLPQPTWWERQTAWLSERGLIPGEIIGNGPPTNDNGEFDYAQASFYWRFFYWIDSHFGTDYCGLRED